jgi:hypothetical protein
VTDVTTDRDTIVRCDNCQREEHVDFAACLSTGWPKCYCTEPRYGYTMRLVTTKADIGAATRTAIQAQLR